MKRYIYGLICPLNNTIRYIGQTKRPLNKRLQSHFDEYRRNKKLKKFSTHKFNWMAKLDREGLLKNIKIALLEETTLNKVDRKEQYWIKQYNNLVNSSPGGNVHSIETIKKISDSKMGKKNPNFGKKLSDEHKRKLLAGADKAKDKLKKIRQTNEFKQKISDAFSKKLILLDADLKPIKAFKNCRECADYLGYKTANIKNAVRQSRPVGRWKGIVRWVVREENLEDNIARIKDRPENSKILRDKKF